MKRKMTIPLSLCVVGVLMLMGCIYIPIPEHPVDKTQKDFRPMLGTETTLGPLHVGITRQQVIALLGEPAFKSPDGANAVYFVDTETGFYVSISPACFGPTQATDALVVVYDPGGIVRKLESRGLSPGLELFNVYHIPYSEAHRDYLKYQFVEIPTTQP